MEYESAELTYEIISAAIEVHRVLGPGLLESAYRSCLCCEFDNRKVRYRKEQAVPFAYKGNQVECGYRVDLLVEGRVIVELKAVDGLLPIHKAQLLTYLRLMRLHVGLLINFNVPVLKQGVQRVVLNAAEHAPVGS